MKILVGIPCMETVPVEFVNSLLRLHKPYETKIMLLPLSAIDAAREKIAQYALDEKFDYVMFIDSDMVFSYDLITRLLEHDKDIITGLAFMRKPPYSPCIYSKLRLAEPGGERVVYYKDYPSGLIEVEGCGMAACLIKTEVFKNMYDNMNVLAKAGYGTRLFNPFDGYGEDFSFCLRARKLGYKIYADTTMKLGHIGHMICTEDTYKAWNEVSE